MTSVLIAASWLLLVEGGCHPPNVQQPWMIVREASGVERWVRLQAPPVQVDGTACYPLTGIESFYVLKACQESSRVSVGVWCHQAEDMQIIGGNKGVVCPAIEGVCEP